MPRVLEDTVNLKAEPVAELMGYERFVTDIVSALRDDLVTLLLDLWNVTMSMVTAQEEALPALRARESRLKQEGRQTIDALKDVMNERFFTEETVTFMHVLQHVLSLVFPQGTGGTKSLDPTIIFD